MRQQHQKSRSRGRGRKQQNPLSRNFESNGPDVKIRGNAAHIAEKYATLARDCLSNGDRVIAENYLQHAEHYNRIVAAAQAQNAQVAKNAEEQAAANATNTAEKSEKSEKSEKTEQATKPAENSEKNGSAEVVANSNGAEAPVAEKKPRRNARPQRSKKAAVSEDDAPAKVEIAVDNDSISEDAASLPDTITGSLAVNEG